MELSADLLKQFAKNTKYEADSSKEAVLYGTTSISSSDDERVYVKLDGTDNLTPVSKATDAKDGDRVMVMIKNHTATIIGNISSPASARTASSYMNLTNEGLVIGELDNNGKATGMFALIAPGCYYIVDNKGNKVASFSSEIIKLGNEKAVFSVDSISLQNGSLVITPEIIKMGGNNTSEIQLCDGNGSIRLDDDTLILYAKNAIGIKSEFSDDAGTNSYRSEVVCKAEDTNPIAGIQSYKKNGESSSVLVELDGGISLNTPNGKTAYLNGSEIINSDSIVVNGTIKGTGKVKGDSTIVIKKTVSIPSGYYLTGIRQITTNHDSLCHITEFTANPSTNEVGVKLKNTGSSELSLEVKIVWFALRSKGDKYSTDDIIEW